MRKENNGIRYFGFNEVAKEVYGLDAPTSTIKNAEKKENLKKKFEEKNTCPECKTPLTYVGGNVLACTSPKCSGKSIYKLLDERTTRLARGIFGEDGVRV